MCTGGKLLISMSGCDRTWLPSFYDNNNTTEPADADAEMEEALFMKASSYFLSASFVYCIARLAGSRYCFQRVMVTSLHPSYTVRSVMDKNRIFI
jgi:hypothetical protein